jgi:hypothetical protein
MPIQPDTVDEWIAQRPHAAPRKGWPVSFIFHCGLINPLP